MSSKNIQEKIYIVDDDPTLLEILKTKLSSYTGSEIETYRSAEGFLGHYDNRGGILILDHYMEGMSGLELQKFFKLENDPIRVIFLTCAEEPNVIIRAFRNGACDYLIKPVEPGAVANSILDLLYKKKKRAYDQYIKYAVILWAMIVISVGIAWFIRLESIGANELAGFGMLIGLLAAAFKFYPVKRNGN